MVEIRDQAWWDSLESITEVFCRQARALEFDPTICAETRLGALSLKTRSHLELFTQCDLPGNSSLEDLAKSFLVVSYYLLHKMEDTSVH